MSRRPCPSGVSDAERAFLAPYPTLMREDAPRRVHPLRELLDGLRCVLRASCARRMMPHDLPPRPAVQRQARRRAGWGCFEATAHDLREVPSLEEGRHAPPAAAILDGRVLRGTSESGRRAGHGGAGRTKGSRVHLTRFVTPADVDEGKAVAGLARRIREETGDTVGLAYVDQGYTGHDPAKAAEGRGHRLEAVKRPEAKRGFVLLPRRWVVERSLAWPSRLERLAKDCERLPETSAGFRVLAFRAPMLGALAPWLQGA